MNPMEMEMKMSIESTYITPLSKSATTIVQNISASSVKLMEVTEYCNLAEAYLKECEKKIESLRISKNEMERLRLDLIKLNKTNATNSESLFRAKNELYKYKCDLKLEYIVTERAIKSRKLKCNKILSHYENNWEKTLEKYQNIPDVIELRETQKEVSDLEMSIENFKKLKQNTEIEVSVLKKNLEKKFLEKIVEFAKLVVNKNSKESVLKLVKQDEKNTLVKLSSVLGLNFFHSKISLLPTTDVLNDSQDKMCDETPVDVTMFDNLSIPSEHLEMQNEDEYFIFTPEGQENNTEERSQPDAMEVDLNPNDDTNNQEKSLENNSNVNNSDEIPEKMETESQYFGFEKQNKTGKASVMGQKKTSKVQMKTKEYFENFEESSRGLKRKIQNERDEGDVDVQKEMTKEPENEELLSDGSENIPEDNLQYQYSFSSGESWQHSEKSCNGNVAEKSDSSNIPKVEVNNTNFHQKDEKEETTQKFGGFFSMENEANPAKPSIFKLF